MSQHSRNDSRPVASAPGQRTRPVTGDKVRRSTHSKRLRRLDRVWLGNLWPRYFLTICVQDRKCLLANDAVHQRFRDFLETSSEHYQWWPTRYVLMLDHLHLLVHEGPGAVTLGAWVKALKAVVGRRQFKWQSGFFDHVLRSDESESQKWEYVRMNPVRAGLVATPEQWPFGGEIDQDVARPIPRTGDVVGPVPPPGGEGAAQETKPPPGEGTRPTT